MSSSLSPRPAPPNEQLSSRTLHPIYQAVDTHNYTKALKLTSTSEWDIVRALRVHALERSGKRREALMLLWDILVSNVVVFDNTNNEEDDKKKKKPREVWSELYERIVSLTDAADLVNDSSNNGLDIQLMDAVQRLDVRAYAPISLPNGVGGGSSTMASSSSSTTSSSAKGSTTAKSSSSSGKHHGKSSKGGKSKQSNKKSSSTTTTTTNSSTPISLPPVTDETVLQTISVTLRIEGLYDTMSEMYFQAMETMMSQQHDVENHKSVLEEGVCVHFRAVCDCSNVVEVGLKVKNNAGVDDDSDGGEMNGAGGSSSSVLSSSLTIAQAQLPKLQTLLNLTKYYERMQTSSLQLAKISAQPLHFQWTAMSSLWYKESLQELVSTLETIQSLLFVNAAPVSTEKNGDNNAIMGHLQKYALQMLGLSSSDTTNDTIPSYSQKLKQKMALLPRLAESLSSRMVSQSMSSSGNNPQKKVVSENDWDVYLETLLIQDKKEDAIEVLKKIQGTPMMSSGCDEKNNSGGNSSIASGNNTAILPQIDDEHTIENHVGSFLPYTQRKKLERLAQLSQELGMYQDAEGYYRELLHVFPDQWTYWLGLVDVCVWMESSSSGVDRASSGGSVHRSSPMNEEGWIRCQSYANEVISTTSIGEKHALRGPRLILLELASMKVRQVSGIGASTNGEGKEGMITALCDDICRYGDTFGPAASCCFADIRSYLSVLVQVSLPNELSDISSDVLFMLQWAKELWVTNCQSNDADAASDGGEVSADAFRERRKKIRTFIFAVQVVYTVAVELKGSTLQLLEEYAPSTLQMVSEWRTSLSFLPGVAPKDGGQKEVLPGDEIILLTSQYLQFQATKQSSNNSAVPFLLRAAGVLEEAIDQSPYNPHLKIAAIGIYSQLHAAHRALTIYEDLGVKQIQLDSCSYLILPVLIRGGLYTSAIKLSTSILRLHGSTSKEVKDFASKSLRNGLLFKAQEMAIFQTEKMRPSLQLLHSKGLVMDTAALMVPSDLVSDIAGGAKQKTKSPPIMLGAEKGFCGSDQDLARSEQIAIDAELHFNAPAIIHAAGHSSSVDDYISSDNRDVTVNNFEILYHNLHLTQKEMVRESLRRGHMHGLLTRAVMATGAANPPKKGKVPKSTEETMYRCQSLRQALSRAKEFSQVAEMDKVEKALWDACCQISEVIIVVIHGTDSKSSDTLAEREKAAVSIVESTIELVQSAREAMTACCSVADESNDSSSVGARVCELLPNYVVSFYVLLETAARLFSLFGWGKRKRMTKAASGALANLALSFHDLLSEMLQAMSKFRSFCGDSGDMALESMVGSTTSLEVDSDVMQRVVKEVVLSRDMTKDRVDPFLTQMKESLLTFDEK